MHLAIYQKKRLRFLTRNYRRNLRQKFRPIQSLQLPIARCRLRSTYPWMIISLKGLPNPTRRRPPDRTLRCPTIWWMQTRRALRRSLVLLRAQRPRASAFQNYLSRHPSTMGLSTKLHKCPQTISRRIMMATSHKTAHRREKSWERRRQLPRFRLPLRLRQPRLPVVRTHRQKRPLQPHRTQSR